MGQLAQEKKMRKICFALVTYRQVELQGLSFTNRLDPGQSSLFFRN